MCTLTFNNTIAVKRLVAFLILLLYLYNLAGYLVAFSVLQQRIQREVKLMLKATVPPSELMTFSFHSEQLQRGDYGLVWLKKNEFRYRGGMYDVVSQNVVGDSTQFFCINDVQEERLFENLALHVQRQTGDSPDQKNLDSFHGAFKHSLHTGCTWLAALFPTGRSEIEPREQIVSMPRDVLLPPPRFLTAS